MKSNQAKGFTFKVANQAETQTQAKTRDGVANAGCTAVFLFDGTREWKMDAFWGYPRKDNGYFC